MRWLDTPDCGEVWTMVYKSSVWNGRSFRNTLGDEARFGEELLLHLFLATDESDELIADRSALQLAQQQLDRQPFPSGLSRRRVLPPRRHLRNK